jgi:hypothetical protein
MKIEKFQLRGNNSVCTGAFRLLRGRAPAQLRGNNAISLRFGLNSVQLVPTTIYLVIMIFAKIDVMKVLLVLEGRWMFIFSTFIFQFLWPWLQEEMFT